MNALFSGPSEKILPWLRFTHIHTHTRKGNKRSSQRCQRIFCVENCNAHKNAPSKQTSLRTRKNTANRQRVNQVYHSVNVMDCCCALCFILWRTSCFARPFAFILWVISHFCKRDFLCKFSHNKQTWQNDEALFTDTLKVSSTKSIFRKLDFMKKLP